MSFERQPRHNPDTGANAQRKNRARIAAEAALNVISHIGHGVADNRAFPYIVTLGIAGLALLTSQGNMAQASTIAVAGAGIGKGISIEQNLRRANS